MMAGLMAGLLEYIVKVKREKAVKESTFTCHTVRNVAKCLMCDGEMRHNQKLTVAGQQSRFELVKTGRDSCCRLVGVGRQFLHVEVGHSDAHLLINGLDLDGRFQVLRLVLDGRFPFGPQLHHLLLGIDDHFVGEAGLETDGVGAGAQPNQQQQSGQWKAVAHRCNRRHSSTCDR